MKNRSNTLLKLFLGLNLLALIVVIGINVNRYLRHKAAQQERAEAAIRDDVGSGAFNSKDAARMISILHQFEDTGSINDGDLNFLLSLLQCKGVPQNVVDYRLSILGVGFREIVGKLSSTQKHTVAEAMVTFASDTTVRSETGFNIRIPIGVLTDINDPRAISIAQHALHDPRSGVRDRAKKSLIKLGQPIEAGIGN